MSGADVLAPAITDSRTGMVRRLVRPLHDRALRGIAIGAAVIVAMLVAAFFAPLPFSPTAPDPLAVLVGPSGTHWLGTDLSGFDVFSRTIASARRDLPLALVGTGLSLLIGVPLGLLASSKSAYSGWIMRGLDVFQAFPLVIIAIAVVTLTGNHLSNVVLAIAIINVPRFMRLVRSETLTLRESRFVEAAIASGCSPARVMFRHLLPNVRAVILAQCSLTAASAIIVIAALNFLGVGVSPPTPSWGSMIQDGAENVTTGQWWTFVAPGTAILLTVVSLNLIADGLQAHAEDDAR
jgi:peptide/nickel transport system permease protein